VETDFLVFHLSDAFEQLGKILDQFITGLRLTIDLIDFHVNETKTVSCLVAQE
jgi:hypothetical protein